MYNLQVDNLVADAFSTWEAVSPLRFSKETSEAAAANINIEFVRYLVFEMMSLIFGIMYLEFGPYQQRPWNI